MGATNGFYETNIGFQLLGKECQKCFRKFTQPEIDDRNFDVWFDTSNEVGLKPISEDENSFISTFSNYIRDNGRINTNYSSWVTNNCI